MEGLQDREGGTGEEEQTKSLVGAGGGRGEDAAQGNRQQRDRPRGDRHRRPRRQ